MQNEQTVTVGQLLNLLREFGDDASIDDFVLDEYGSRGTCEVISKRGRRGEGVVRLSGAMRMRVSVIGPKGWYPRSVWLYGGLGNTIATLKALPKSAECAIHISRHADDIADEWLDERGASIQATDLLVFAKTGTFAIRLSNDLRT